MKRVVNHSAASISVGCYSINGTFIDPSDSCV